MLDPPLELLGSPLGQRSLPPRQVSATDEAYAPPIQLHVAGTDERDLARRGSGFGKSPRSRQARLVEGMFGVRMETSAIRAAKSTFLRAPAWVPTSITGNG